MRVGLTNPLSETEVRRVGRLTVMCIVTGLVAGLGAAGFYVMLEAGRSFCLGELAHYHPIAPGNEPPLFESATDDEPLPMRRWMFLILPAVGGLIGGIIVFSLAPEAEGHGTDAAIEAYHFKDGNVRKRVPFIKALSSMITIGTGGSAGREGPIAQIGSGFGSMLAQWLNLSPHERRTLMAAGMAAGIGAIFHAPLAGALFVTEVLYRGPDFEHEVLVPSFISSIISYSVFGAIFGFEPLFVTPGYAFDNVARLLPYLILAGVSSLGVMLFVRSFYGFRNLMFNRLTRIPNYLKPAIGGLGVGVIGFFLPEALGAGYGVLQMIFSGEVTTLPSAESLHHVLPWDLTGASLAAVLLVVIAIAKIGTTAMTVGSGGSGGVFGPAVVIGGALGGATGLVCAEVFPTMGIQPGAFALVGMAGFFAGAANTPVSTMIMVSEMTGNYNLLVPSMMVSICCYALCRRFTLYEEQLPSRLDAPSKLGNMAGAILRNLTVQQALTRRQKDGDLVIVEEDADFSELVDRFVGSTQSCFPVVTKDQALVGMINATDIRRIITETGISDLIIAGDIDVPAITVTVGDSLLAAINNMVKTDTDELVVVDERDEQRIVGTLSRSDIIAAYNRQIVGTN